MNKLTATLKRFFTAEEVPRWFGLSLVLVYLVGLGAVGHLGIREARREAATHFRSSTRYAFQGLASRLCLSGHADTLDPRQMRLFQQALYEFAMHVPATSLRIVDSSRRVVTAIKPTEVGSIVSDDSVGSSVPASFEVKVLDVGHKDAPQHLLRTPLTDCSAGDVGDRMNISANSSGAHSERLYLEARLPAQPYANSSLVDQADTLTVVLVALGALYGLYHCLRNQLRGMSRIAGRLETHRDRIEDNIASLRIADTLDGATVAWNELIDLTQSLIHSDRRNEADAELTRVLENSSGGALAEALNAIPDGVIYITDEVRFEYLNAMACHLFGWNLKQARQISLSEAKSEGVGDTILNTLRESQRADGSFEARTVVLEADAQQLNEGGWYRVWVIPLHRAHHDGECIVIIRDVSQQDRAERAREEFVTQVTHELRTPLTNIRAYAETLSSGMFDDPKVITECYNVITKETRRLSRLIEDILSVSQLEVGSLELEWDTVDLKALLTDGVRDVRGIADEKNIDLQLILPSKMEPVRADRDKLAVVINNLLGNAIKYTLAHGNVIVGCQYTGGEVALTVKDNGIGIDASDHARIFEKFQRGQDTQVQEETGTGIGLYTAREIIRRHGGDIEVVSQKGEGATFMAKLPHQQSRAAAMTTTQEVKDHG